MPGDPLTWNAHHLWKAAIALPQTSGAGHWLVRPHTPKTRTLLAFSRSRLLRAMPMHCEFERLGTRRASSRNAYLRPPERAADEGNQHTSLPRSFIMLHWALVFLVVALVAGLFGFTGIYVAAAGIARILFVVFLVLFLISLISGRMRGPVA